MEDADYVSSVNTTASGNPKASLEKMFAHKSMDGFTGESSSVMGLLV